VLCNEDGKRAADMIACGPLQVACIDSTFQHRLRDADKISWILTLASVVNHKLEQATGDRSSLQQSADDREALLRRFADNDALGLVKLAAEGLANPIQDREVIVWFSDVANFSTWAAGKDPNEIARIIRQLTSIQIDLIRDANGIVDKLIGDGVMAFWFVDSPDRASNPGKAILCAREAITLVRQAVKKEGLDKVLDLRIGLHTGPAVFGDFGAKDRIAVTVLGATVNIAARYEQAKSPALGPLRISPELKKLADRADQLLDYFEGPIEVEVKHDVVIPIYSTKMENSNVMES
jgi:class 3 adenylate cyclase